MDDQQIFTRAKTWMDFTRQLGVAPNEFTDVYWVNNGKITTCGSTITEQALFKSDESTICECLQDFYAGMNLIRSLSMDYVVHILLDVFLLTIAGAVQVMYTANYHGSARVQTLP